MLEYLIACALLQGRTGPLAVSAPLKRLEFSLSEFFGQRVQIGRIQVAHWTARSDQNPEALAKGMAGWKRTSDYNLWFERSVGKVRQSLSFTEATDDFGDTYTSVALVETPPEDGSIPRDWPTQLRRGIFRVLPILPAPFRGEPDRIETTVNPSGMGAMATYKFPGSVADLDRALRPKLQGWSRQASAAGIRYTLQGSNPTFEFRRRLHTITLENRDGGTRAAARWSPGRYDFVGSNPRVPVSIVAKPRVPLPKVLGSDFGFADALPHGTFGGRMLTWETVLPIRVTDIAKKLSAVKPRVIDGRAGPQGGLTFHATAGSVLANVTIRPGRTDLSKALPKGWRATADFAGFLDPVTTRKGEVSTVTISEQLTRADGKWPAAARYAWPPKGTGMPPIPEMRVQPSSVYFPTTIAPWEGNPRVLIARWEVTPTVARRKALDGWTHRSKASEPLRKAIAEVGRDGRVSIQAWYKMSP